MECPTREGHYFSSDSIGKNEKRVIYTYRSKNAFFYLWLSKDFALISLPTIKLGHTEISSRTIGSFTFFYLKFKINYLEGSTSNSF